MKEKAVEIISRKRITLIVNGDEYRIGGWPINKTVFVLDIMNVSKISKYGYSYPQALSNGCAFEYSVKNNVESIAKALYLLCEELL